VFAVVEVAVVEAAGVVGVVNDGVFLRGVRAAGDLGLADTPTDDDGVLGVAGSGECVFLDVVNNCCGVGLDVDDKLTFTLGTDGKFFRTSGGGEFVFVALLLLLAVIVFPDLGEDGRAWRKFDGINPVAPSLGR